LAIGESARVRGEPLPGRYPEPELVEDGGIVRRPAFRQQAGHLLSLGFIGVADAAMRLVRCAAAGNEPGGGIAKLRPVKPPLGRPTRQVVQLAEERAVDATAGAVGLVGVGDREPERHHRILGQRAVRQPVVR
jgi:hypothetical protein